MLPLQLRSSVAQSIDANLVCRFESSPYRPYGNSRLRSISRIAQTLAPRYAAASLMERRRGPADMDCGGTFTSFGLGQRNRIPTDRIAGRWRNRMLRPLFVSSPPSKVSQPIRLDWSPLRLLFLARQELWEEGAIVYTRWSAEVRRTPPLL